MTISEKLLGFDELAATKRLSHGRSAAFKMYCRQRGEKLYQTPERWSALLKEYDERNINDHKSK